MLAFFVLNLTIALSLLFWPYWFSRRYLGLSRLNPLTIPMLVGMPVELMKLVAGPILLVKGGLWSPAFQLAVLMGNLLSISSLAGTLFFFSLVKAVRIERFLPFNSAPLRRRHLRRASWFFLIILALAFGLLASAQLGILEWIKNPRIGYQLYRTGQGHWYALAVSALSVGSMLSFASNPSPTAIMLKTALFVGLAYLLGSKAAMLAMFVAGMVMLSFLNWKHLPKLFFLGTPLVFLLLVWNLYLALTDTFELVSVVQYFDYYKNAANYYAGVMEGNIQLFFGDILSTSYWAYVPRGFYPDKPVVYGILHVNEIFYPGQAALTNTPAFGGAVEQYADFGVVGVLILGFFGGQTVFNACLYWLAFRKPGINLREITLGQFLVLLVMSGPLFGLYFPGVLYWILLLAVAATILALRSIRKRSSVLLQRGTT